MSSGNCSGPVSSLTGPDCIRLALFLLALSSPLCTQVPDGLSKYSVRPAVVAIAVRLSDAPHVPPQAMERYPARGAFAIM